MGRRRCALFLSIIVLATLALAAACSGQKPGSGFGAGSSGGAGGGTAGSDGNGSGGIFGSSSGGPTSGSTGSTATPLAACPPGLECNVSCPSGGTTTISGTVYDPAARNPLYNAAVYVPVMPLEPLPKGVPTGSDACACSALFKSGASVSAATAVDGTFRLSNAPVGTNVPLVVQIGKWRRQYTVNVTACQDNHQPDKSLTLPSSVAAPTDSLPDIAVSTGSADSLECLMRRIGLPTTEYVAGSGTSGHVHVFSGGDPGLALTNGGMVGTTEQPSSMAGAPTSFDHLWDSQDDLMPYDIVLLSCEGGETYNANPAALEAYLNAGGRAFASHYHYSWFSGPIGSAQNYSAPADWGAHGDKLASWTAGANGSDLAIGGVLDTTLNGSSQTFPKGVALLQWLGLVDALGQNGVPAHEVSIFQPRFNALVNASNTPSQPWITSDIGSNTMYFSFDTPVGAMGNLDQGGPTYCGRAVFSDLHVAGNPATTDVAPPPQGCADVPLSPQEKVLEFMLFDLSSCVIPDSQYPPDAGVPVAVQ